MKAGELVTNSITNRLIQRFAEYRYRHLRLGKIMSNATTKYPQAWDLLSILPQPGTAEFHTVLTDYQRDLQALAERSDQLSSPGQATEVVSTWVRFLADFQKVETRAGDLNSLIGCYAAGDATNKLYQQLEGQLSALSPLRERIVTNLDFALKAASDSDLQAFLDADPQLKTIAYFLKLRRRQANFRLPKDQELLVSELSVDGLHAWGRLYDRHCGELRISLMEKGEVVTKSVGQVRFDMPDRATRENNFFAADKAWKTIEDTCADAINHIAGSRLTVYKRIGVRDHLDLPLAYNRMSRATLDAMWGAITARKGMLLEYFERKAKALGLKKMAWYDQQASYPTAREPGQSDEVPYDDAVNHIVKTFTHFSPDFGNFAKMACEKAWIEAENRPGKRQGGFCTGFPGPGESRIFMTYTDSEDSMSTLAHELGHAYHSWVLREQPLVLQDYPMNLAETASTFAECVLAEERLARMESASGQIRMLDNMLADAVAFLMNIHCRFIFENQFHVERATGEVSAQRLCELMTSAQKEAYQEALCDEGWNSRFWVSKLHFYITSLPFYNFPYTFGYLLSLGAYALAKESGGKDFPQKYRQLLIATGCMDAEEAVKSTLGYDLTQPDFWNKSLDVVERRLRRFLELTA